MKTKSLLKFNGHNLSYSIIDGKTYIAIRPICNALGLNVDRQIKIIKRDPILSHVYTVASTRDAENRIQKMAVLPEQFIYGWLFGIRSQSEVLQNYKLQCHQILWNYFHGRISERRQILQEKNQVKIQMSHLRDKLKANEDYQQLNKLQGRHLNLANMLKEIDEEESLKQLELFNG